MAADVLKKPLAKNLEIDLVEKLYRTELEESSWTFFRVLKHARDEHAAVVMKVLKEADDDKAHLVRAAQEADGAEGIRAAGAYYSYIGSSSHLPGLLKRLKKDASKFDELVPSIRRAVAQALPGDEPDTLGFFGMVYLVARADPKDELIPKIAKANERWGDEYDTLNRVLAAAAS